MFVLTVPPFHAGHQTVSALETLILAMALNPDIQPRAQEAIDKVVGTGRLPDFSHNIPYVDAIVREVLRWGPVAPMGIYDFIRDHLTPTLTCFHAQVVHMQLHRMMYTRATIYHPELWF
jgi:cytochrome P450